MPTMLMHGGARGIGRPTALALAEPGARVAIAARTRAQLEETAAAIRDRGAEALLLPMDVADESAVAAGFAELRTIGARLDGLVNNAGVGGGLPPHKTDTASWRRILDTHRRGTFLVTPPSAPLLAAR